MNIYDVIAIKISKKKGRKKFVYRFFFMANNLRPLFLLLGDGDGGEGEVILFGDGNGGGGGGGEAALLGNVGGDGGGEQLLLLADPLPLLAPVFPGVLEVTTMGSLLPSKDETI